MSEMVSEKQIPPHDEWEVAVKGEGPKGTGYAVAIHADLAKARKLAREALGDYLAGEPRLGNHARDKRDGRTGWICAIDRHLKVAWLAQDGITREGDAIPMDDVELL
jgi:hypothetical protein